MHVSTRAVLRVAWSLGLASVVATTSYAKAREDFEQTVAFNPGGRFEIENKNERLKKFQRMVKGAAALECKACGKRYNGTLFAPHLKLCKKAAAASMLFEHDAEQIVVKAVDVVTVRKGFRQFGGFSASPEQRDEAEGYETEKVYKLFVSYFGQPWYVQRKILAQPEPSASCIPR